VPVLTGGGWNCPLLPVSDAHQPVTRGN
jgi:hypothetical protein